MKAFRRDAQFSQSLSNLARMKERLPRFLRSTCLVYSGNRKKYVLMKVDVEISQIFLKVIKNVFPIS